MRILLENFGGMLPIINETLLPDTGASYSVNAWMYSGAISGLRESTARKTGLDTATRYCYRIPLSEDLPYDYTNSFYMEFTDPVATVVRAPVFNDTYKRYYWCAPTIAPSYNTQARILNGDPEFILGVPNPGTKPTVTVTGGSGDQTDRVYVTTWVTAYGEESGPSPAETKLSQYINGSWGISIPVPSAGERTDRNLLAVRLYRTVVTPSGVPVFFRVTEQNLVDGVYTPIAYTDTAADSDLTANAQLESFLYSPPPTDLSGMVLGPNGILVGWRENEVWFSEPYRPHAWVADNVLTVEWPIVNIGVTGQTMIVLTKGNPFWITGSLPNNMTPSKYMAFEPCLSRPSMVASDTGIYYVSPNGLINIVPGDMRNLTREIIDRNMWLNDFNAEYIYGARLNSAYFGFGSIEAGCFEATAFDVDSFEQADYSAARDGFYIDTQNTRVGVNLLHETQGVLSAFEDTWTGDAMYIGEDNTLYSMNPADGTSQRYFTWRSKAFRMPKPNNMSAIKVRFLPEDPAFGDAPYELTTTDNPVDPFGWVRVYADGRLVMDQQFLAAGQVQPSGQIFRIPSGFKAEFWVVEVEARVRVMAIEFVSAMRELNNA